MMVDINNIANALTHQCRIGVRRPRSNLVFGEVAKEHNINNMFDSEMLLKAEVHIDLYSDLSYHPLKIMNDIKFAMLQQ